MIQSANECATLLSTAILGTIYNTCLTVQKLQDCLMHVGVHLLANLSVLQSLLSSHTMHTSENVQRFIRLFLWREVGYECFSDSELSPQWSHIPFLIYTTRSNFSHRPITHDPVLSSHQTQIEWFISTELIGMTCTYQFATTVPIKISYSRNYSLFRQEASLSKISHNKAKQGAKIANSYFRSDMV